MQKVFAIIAAWVLLTSAGCRETDCDTVYKHSFWEDAEGVRARMDSYKHILTVRIDENHNEDRGPHILGELHFKGKVVKIWKGDWTISEPISLVHYVDYRPPTTTSNGAAGKLSFVFTNEHTNTEIAVGTGEIGYSKDEEQVLDCFFHK